MRNDHEGGTVELRKIRTLGRLARFAALGLSMGMPPRTACAHAMEAEGLRSYAACLGFTPGEVARFLESGMTIEQAKRRMAEGKHGSGVPGWIADRAEEVAGELTRELGLEERGLRFSFDSAPVPVLRTRDEPVPMYQLDQLSELCFHPETKRMFSMEPADQEVITFMTRCTNPRCGLQVTSVTGYPTLPAPWVIKR